MTGALLALQPHGLALVVAGVGVLLAVALDQFSTILGTGPRRGFASVRIQSLMWRLGRGINRRGSDRLQSAVGSALVGVAPAMWVVGLWVGWSLIVVGDDLAVVESSTKAPASIAGRVYFAGFNLFTLGLGDLQAGTDIWRLVIVVSSLMGLGMITLAVTYLVPVIQAATARRALARVVALAVPTGPGGAEDASERLMSVLSEITSVAEQHLTYPVLRYHHSVQPESSLNLQLRRARAWLSGLAAHERPAAARVLQPALDDLARAMTGEWGDGADLDAALRRLDGRDADGRSARRSEAPA